MSYEFKKLSEVEALTEVPEGAKVLAEANGQIVRVPGSGLGGGSGSSVQPDWNQNDSSAPDYIKNRPFYETVQLTAFLEEQQIDFSSYFEIPESIVKGETYIVHWDNDEYTIEATLQDVFGDGSIMIPYLKQADGLFEISGMSMTAADKGIHNVAIYITEIYRKTIDAKYAPVGNTIKRIETTAVNYDENITHVPDGKIKFGASLPDAVLTEGAQVKFVFTPSGTLTIGGRTYVAADSTTVIATSRGFVESMHGTLCEFNFDGTIPLILLSGNVNYSVSGVSYDKKGFLTVYFTGNHPNKNGTATGSMMLKIAMTYEKNETAYDGIIMWSTTEGSTKRFTLTVNDSGTLTATEVTV